MGGRLERKWQGAGSISALLSAIAANRLAAWSGRHCATNRHLLTLFLANGGLQRFTCVHRSFTHLRLSGPESYLFAVPIPQRTPFETFSSHTHHHPAALHRPTHRCIGDNSSADRPRSCSATRQIRPISREANPAACVISDLNSPASLEKREQRCQKISSCAKFMSE